MKRFAIFCMLFVILATTFCTSMQTFAFAESPMDLKSKSGILMDYSSKEVLFEKDADKELPVASMVKMMTILLTLDEFDAGRLTEQTMITTTENASSMGGSQVFIDPFVDYSAGDLLKSVIMASANDASVALAEHISGSEEGFVVKMNEKAKAIGMTNTNYVNCTGLPAPEQYSSARDSALLLCEVTGHELYHKYSTIWMDELTHPSGRKTGLVNTNRLVRYYEGCDGGKTGSTNEAGCCLSASAKRNNMRLISVIVGAPNSQTRFNECSKLFNYGFANYENKTLVSSSSALDTVAVNKGKIDKVDLFAEEDFSAVVKKGSKDSFEVSMQKPESVSAPTKSGESVGKIIISRNGNVVKEINMIVKEDLEKMSLFDGLGKIVKAW